MFKNLKERLDPKMTKICVYAGVTVIATCVLLFLLYVTSGFWAKLWNLFLTVLQPIVTGGIICYLLTPMVNKWESLFYLRKKTAGQKKRWTRPVAICLSFLVILAVIGLLLMLIVLTMYHSMSSINMDTVMGFLAEARKDLISFADSIIQKLEGIGISSARITTVISRLVVGVKDTVGGLVFGIIFSIYFLLDGKEIATYWKRALRLLAGKKATENLDAFSADANRVFSGYIRGQFIDATVVGILGSFSLLIAGVPNAVVVGVMAGLGNLIPYVGPVLGMLTLALVCIPTAAWTKLLTGGIVLAVIMLLDGNVIGPKLLSNNIKIHPLLVIAALIGGGALGGLVGMIIAVPVAALCKLQLDRYLDKKEKEVERK